MTPPEAPRQNGPLVLVIDDDERLCRLLEDYVARFGMEAISATHPERGIALLRERRPDVIVLDVMLPGRDGFEVCRQIRASGDETPIVMLTARGELSDRVVGLELGADDYLAKPFEPRELVARLQALVRRARSHRGSPQVGGEAVLCFGDLEISTTRRVATLAGGEVDLTTTEYELLELFARNPDAVLTRDRIMNELRGVDWEAFDRAIDVAVSRLRQKLGDSAKTSRWIKTIWGSGYRFVAERTEVRHGPG